ncbi:MAG: aldo/keto reductase, partial [Actinomycetota bacterium]|nr:aldo/keto reductase [Actinomycetota bacterium]
GAVSADTLEATDSRATGRFPRFEGEALDANQRLVAKVRELAEAKGCTPGQLALAWVLAKPVVSAPIVGASKPHHLEDAIAALSLELSAEEIALLEAPYVPHPIVGFQ